MSLLPMGGKLGALDSFVVTLNLSLNVLFFSTYEGKGTEMCWTHLVKAEGRGVVCSAGQQFMVRGGGIQYPHDGECS